MPEIRQWHASDVAPAWHLFSAKCGADLLCGALLARFVLIMGINAQRHIDRGVSCEILNLLDTLSLSDAPLRSAGAFCIAHKIIKAILQMQRSADSQELICTWNRFAQLPLVKCCSCNFNAIL